MSRRRNRDDWNGFIGERRNRDDWNAFIGERNRQGNPTIYNENRRNRDDWNGFIGEAVASSLPDHNIEGFYKTAHAFEVQNWRTFYQFLEVLLARIWENHRQDPNVHHQKIIIQEPYLWNRKQVENLQKLIAHLRKVPGKADIVVRTCERENWHSSLEHLENARIHENTTKFHNRYIRFRYGGAVCLQSGIHHFGDYGNRGELFYIPNASVPPDHFIGLSPWRFYQQHYQQHLGEDDGNF